MIEDLVPDLLWKPGEDRSEEPGEQYTQTTSCLLLPGRGQRHAEADLDDAGSGNDGIRIGRDPAGTWA